MSVTIVAMLCTVLDNCLVFILFSFIMNDFLLPIMLIGNLAAAAFFGLQRHWLLAGKTLAMCLWKPVFSLVSVDEFVIIFYAMCIYSIRLYSM